MRVDSVWCSVSCIVAFLLGPQGVYLICIGKFIIFKCFVGDSKRVGQRTTYQCQFLPSGGSEILNSDCEA